LISDFLLATGAPHAVHNYNLIPATRRALIFLPIPAHPRAQLEAFVVAERGLRFPAGPGRTGVAGRDGDLPAGNTTGVIGTAR
jgi:hypothetical protein